VAYRQLFIWVEGRDDERFFDGTVRTTFENKYDSVVVRQYAQMTRKEVGRYLRSIKWMCSADCVFVGDINAEPCVTAKKERLRQRYGVESDSVIVVIREIEGWYMAGVGDEASAELGVPVLKNTDTLTKEDFNQLMPERFNSRIDFMVETLKHFCTGMAKRKNGSFRYFAERYGL